MKGNSGKKWVTVTSLFILRILSLLRLSFRNSISYLFSSEIYHFGTAEEVGDELRFNYVCFDEKMTMDFIQRMWLGNTDVSPGHLFHVTLNFKQKTCQRKLIDGASSEFPTTHPYRHGVQGTRYVYLMANSRNKLPYQEVIKVRFPFTSASLFF